MGKATWLLTLFMVFLASHLLIVASRSSLDAKKMVMHTNLSKVEGEEKAAAAAVVDGSMQQVVDVGTSHGRNPPSAPAAAAAAAAASTSARQVPTGPDPIHHHQSPIRH